MLILIACSLNADNQTADLSPVITNKSLPFQISIKLADFALPLGLQSAASAQCGSELLFLAGRSNGLHGFNNDNNNFPPNTQNTTVFVINTHTKKVITRSLYDPSSGLTQQQIDTLSVTSPQYYQGGNTLYMTGGYGVDTSTGDFSTKDTLSAINVAGLIYWVTHPESSTLASQYIRQISNPVFQVTGGFMWQIGNNPTLLIFGQNFAGAYTPGSDGVYTDQVRRFRIIDNGKNLDVIVYEPTQPDPNYRRRDLNVVPIIQLNKHKKGVAALVALAGVFTPTTGTWTVPVDIAANGQTSMADPALAATLKQGMNIYNSAHVPLVSKKGDVYIVVFGGITYEFFNGGVFETDPEFPFTNQVIALKRNCSGLYEQYLVATEYPLILSTESNPGNKLLFGAGARFMPACGVPKSCNHVLDLEKIKKPTVIGYIIGGIQSTLPNTNTTSDSAASPYIFEVTLTPPPRC